MYGTITQQLHANSRELVRVPRDGNSLLRSIALTTSVSHIDLQGMLEATGIEFAHDTNDQANSLENELTEDLRIFKGKAATVESVKGVALPRLSKLLEAKIVVMRTELPPIVYPQDGQSIDENTIVITLDESVMHFDASQIRRVKQLTSTPKNLCKIFMNLDI